MYDVYAVTIQHHHGMLMFQRQTSRLTILISLVLNQFKDNDDDVNKQMYEMYFIKQIMIDYKDMCICHLI